MNEQSYAPENEIPATFWRFIESAGRDPDKLRAILRSLDRTEFASLFRTYANARADLVELFNEREETQDHSEDTLDDLADAILAMGKEAYLDAYYERADLPDEDTWEELPTFVHVFSNVYHEQFSANIFDEIDD
jgi:hypothetical protein